MQNDSTASRRQDAPETIAQAITFDRVVTLAHEHGLCWPCAAQVGWAAQLGYSRVTRVPCDDCRPLVDALPMETSHPAWRRPRGALSKPATWREVVA